MSIIRGIPDDLEVSADEIEFIRADDLDAETVISGLRSGELREWRVDADSGDQWLMRVTHENAHCVVLGRAPMFARDDDSEIEAEDDDDC